MAKSEHFFIGTMSGTSGSKGIYASAIDSETGKLGPIIVAAEAKNPNFLVLSPDKKTLFAALADSVGSFRVGADGKLEAFNQQPCGGAGPCHVSLDATGRVLTVANYSSGDISAFGVAPDGTIGKAFAHPMFTGKGPNTQRQEKAHAHANFFDPENKFLYACDLGSDRIWIFALDTAGPTLLPAKPPAAESPAGSGPRHLVFAPEHVVYVVNELTPGVSRFTRDPATGALTLLDTVPALLPGKAAGKDTASEIELHPSGKWLYVSVRRSDVIAVYAVGEKGQLTLVQNAPALVKIPRHFAIDPSGHWMITEGQNDSRIAVLKIDPKTSELLPTEESATVPSPVCVLFAK